jgi:M6 family metalloprotease-like protein
MSFDTAIPDLDPKGEVYKTEGPTDFTFYARPEGIVKAVMVFVDFPDAPAEPASASDTANHLLGNGQAQALYHAQSYHKLTLDVTVKSDLGWKRMPQPSTKYNFLPSDSHASESHKTYISHAAALFSPSEVRFSDYTFVFLVAPQNAGFPLSPAFNDHRGRGASSLSGEIRLAVTFGTDSYTNSYINLVHEVGHLFGLPDLYPYDGDGVNNSKAGCWSIMSDIFHSESFLGWHRHKNGWLSSSRKTYLYQSISGWHTTLSPLSDSSGLSMVVLPLDNALKPSKVLVIELAQPDLAYPDLGGNKVRWGEGVLVYTVDATIPTGSSPVAIIPKKTSTSPEFGHLYEAPYLLNDTMSYTEGTASITLKILQKFGSSYTIQIDYDRGDPGPGNLRRLQ